MSKGPAVRRRFPHRVECLENQWIPMRDGTRLAARVWLPAGAREAPVPAVVEYIPYRKRDLTRMRDALSHPYFAGHGYASVRVDLRGSGDSEGVLRDEYIQAELDDGVEVLRWMAQQSWCNGRIGMLGISWGGFNGLQIAALQPPELQAVVSVCSTDDRYADDVHYMGGCMLTDNLSWASTMFAFNSLPPDPEIAGDQWREMWMRRLRDSGLWLETWMRHQRRDDYWKHGSVCEDISTVRAPVMAVSGWADGYSNAVFRLVSSLQVPCKGLIGPWSHRYPHEGVPGPAIGFLQECLRWWDRWLRDEDNGVDRDPAIRVWMQDSVAPTTSYSSRPGRWVAEPQWPSSNIRDLTYKFSPGRLVNPEKKIGPRSRTIQSPLSVGLFAGKWCSYSATPDLPHDQREEDGGALIFDTKPLTEELQLMGAPEVELELSADQPVAMLAVRLSNVAPDDKATRVTYGLLNLTHRDNHEHPAPLEPGKRYRVRIKLNDIAQAFPRGHRLRISLSTSYWPLAWAPPRPVRLRIHFGDSLLRLPARAPRSEDRQLRRFSDAEGAAPLAVTTVTGGQHNWRVVRDLATDTSTLEVINDDGTFLIEEIDLQVRSDTREWYAYQGDDFDSCFGETYAVRALARKDWHIETVTRTRLSADSAEFHLHADLDAYEDGLRVYSQTWDTRIPRDLV